MCSIGIFRLYLSLHHMLSECNLHFDFISYSLAVCDQQWPVSSAGQSVVLITRRSRVRSPYGPINSFFSVLDLFSYQRILHHYPLVQNRASQQQKCEKNKGLRSIFKSLQAKSGKNKIASALWPFYTYTHSIRTFHSYAQQDKDTQLRMLLFQK